MAATYFTVTGDYAAFAPGMSIKGNVHFEPLFMEGDIAKAGSMSPPTGFVPFPVTGKISGGNVVALDGSALQLVANVGLGLTGDLYYRVSFSNVTAVEYHTSMANVVVDSRSIVLNGFDFKAPLTSTTIDLIGLSPDPGVVAHGDTSALTISVSQISATGTPSSATFLRGDGSWSPSSGGGSVEPAITAGTTAQYWRGDKTWQTLSQDAVPDGATNKAYSAADKTKLAGIASGATVNSSDATLLSRANHTGTQTSSTISDFSTAADARIAAANKEPAISAGTTAQYWRGDKTWQSFPVTGDVETYTTDTGSAILSMPRCYSGTNVYDWAGVSSGNQQFVYVYPLRTRTISNIGIVVGTAAAGTPTVARLGVYSVDGSGDMTLLASTTHDATLVTSAYSSQVRALNTSVTLTAGNVYAFSLIIVSASAMPVLGGFWGSAAELTLAPRLTARLGGQTDLVSSATAASLWTAQAALYFRAY